MKAMILAAGLGTRLRPYSNYRPKPLFPVLGKPLVSRLIDLLRRQGFRTIIVNCHLQKEQFVEVLQGETGVFLQYEEKVLGTGGGLCKAREFFGSEPFLVVNGDILHSLDLVDIYKQHLAASAPISMVVHDLARFNNLLVSADNKVTALRIGSRDYAPKNSARSLAFAGIQVVDPSIFEHRASSVFFDIIDLYKETITAGIPINAIEVKGHFWTDIGTPTDYLELHRDLLTDTSLADMIGWDVSVDGPVMVDKGAHLGRDVAFAEWAFVGSGAKIGDGSRITRSVVWDGAVVPENTIVEDEIVVG